MKLTYKELLRIDFTKNYLEIEFDEATEQFISIYAYNSSCGTIRVCGGAKEVHRWENEDEAKASSYLNRRYTAVFLDGPAEDPGTEDCIIRHISEYIDAEQIPAPEKTIIEKAFRYLKSVK